jgi:hypothetical protein
MPLHRKRISDWMFYRILCKGLTKLKNSKADKTYTIVDYSIKSRSECFCTKHRDCTHTERTRLFSFATVTVK